MYRQSEKSVEKRAKKGEHYIEIGWRRPVKGWENKSK